VINTQLPTFESADEVQAWLLRNLLETGEFASPRGMLTRELLCVGFQLKNPRARCTASRVRGFSLPLALGEFAWHMSSADDVAPLTYYARRWREFANDESRITGSCYGKKIFQSSALLTSQWERLRHLLTADPDSRRAVLSFWDDSCLAEASVDAPCTSTVQFFVRNRAVHAVVTMRSNDSIWGVPYDVFLFTMLQEYLAVELGLSLGAYTHFAASMHLYERHFNLARRIIEEPTAVFEMPSMDSAEGLIHFLSAERQIRTGETAKLESIAPYWRDLASALLWFRDFRNSSSNEPVGRYANLLALLRPLTSRLREAG
jgi:thymidylate synthase